MVPLSTPIHFRVLEIFTGFTFADVEDFAPLLSLIIGLVAAFALYRTRNEKASYAILAVMLLLSLWPVLPNISLYFMAREFQAVHGSWPQVMVDDPKNWLSAVSPRFDRLFSLTSYLEAFSGAWMVIFFVLYPILKSRFSLVQRRVLCSIVLAGLFILLADPGSLYAWWLD